MKKNYLAIFISALFFTAALMVFDHFYFTGKYEAADDEVRSILSGKLDKAELNEIVRGKFDAELFSDSRFAGLAAPPAVNKKEVRPGNEDIFKAKEAPAER